MTQKLPKRYSGSLYRKLTGVLSFAGAISEDDGLYLFRDTDYSTAGSLGSITYYNKDGYDEKEEEIQTLLSWKSIRKLQLTDKD